MTVRACPFCGLAASLPHETQQGCIAALHAEIARVREILEIGRPIGASPSGHEEAGPQPENVYPDDS